MLKSEQNFDIHKNIMYNCLMYSKELLKGTLQTIILQLLKEHGMMYGYDITQKVRLLSDDNLILTEGALYPTLHKLKDQGLLAVTEESVNNRKRKYYTLSRKGIKVTEQKVNEFSNFMNMVSKILSTKSKA